MINRLEGYFDQPESDRPKSSKSKPVADPESPALEDAQEFYPEAVGQSAPGHLWHFRRLPIDHPMPVITDVSKFNIFTAIMRIWKGNDHKRCSLCKNCGAHDLGNGVAVCTVITGIPVNDSEAAVYSAKRWYGL